MITVETVFDVQNLSQLVAYRLGNMGLHIVEGLETIRYLLICIKPNTDFIGFYGLSWYISWKVIVDGTR